MKINIQRKLDKKGHERICGDCVYMDTKFTFTVHKATKREYEYVVTVNLISPETGQILQRAGKVRNNFRKKLDERLRALEKKIANCTANEREGLKKKLIALEEKRSRLNANLPIEELNATASAYLKDAGNAMIKEHVEVLVLKLYGNNREDIFKCLTLEDSMGELHARTAFDMFQNDFFRSLPAVSRKVLTEKKNALKDFCDFLEKPISGLSDSDITHALEQLSKSKKKYVDMFEKFFDYAGKCKAYNGVNPISLCRANGNLSKKKEVNNSHGTERILTHIPPKVDQKLHDLIQGQLETNDMILDIPLAKGFRMPITRILEITWEDVIIVGDEVLIQDYNKTYSGGTHNYLRPPLRETANFIIARYNHLLERDSKRHLKNQPLVSIPGDTETKQKAALTKHIRDMLQDAGLSVAQINTAADGDKPKASGGAGYQLLCKHYDYVLKDICGVDLDSGIGHYLRSLRIHDTTTDYYRCLSDETGNHFLEVITRRDGYNAWTDGHPAKTSSKLSDDKATRVVTIASGGSKVQTGVLTKKKIFLPAGAELVISASEGVRGSVCFTAETAEEPAEDFKMLY